VTTPTPRALSPSTRRTLWCVLVIVLGVVLANSLFLTGVRDGNPLLLRSGLVATADPSWLPGRQTIDPNDGYVSQALGHAAASQWLHGSVPYWNHYEGLGAPLAGEMQAGALSPFVLLLHFSNGLLYLHVVLEVIAGIATFFFLRRLDLSRWAATGAGLAFACNGTFAWLANAAFNPIAFLPLLLLGIEMAFDESTRSRRRAVLVIAAALGGSLASGFPETAYLSGLLAYSWGALRWWQHRQTWRRPFAALALGTVFGLCLAAPQLVAFLTYLPHANVGIHGTGTYATLPAFGRHAFVLPYLYGPIFGFLAFAADPWLLGWWSDVGGYVGSTALVLAIAALLSRPRRSLKIFLLVWIVLALARIYGLGVLGNVLGYLPGVGAIAFYRYGTIVVEFGVIVLAAMGIDHLVERSASPRRSLVAVAVAIGGIALSAITAAPALESLAEAPHQRKWVAVSVGWAVLGILVVAAGSWLPRRRQRGVVLFGIVALDAMMLFIVPQLSTPGVHKADLDTAPVQYLQAHAGLSTTYSMGPLQPNYGSYFGVRQVNVNDLPVPQNYFEYVTKHLDANVTPVLFTGSNSIDPNGPTPKESFLENLSGFEEVGVKHVLVTQGAITDAEASEHQLQKVFSKGAYEIFELPDPRPYFEVTAGDCDVRPDSYDQVAVSCRTDATIMRRELFMPGWTADADGTALTIGQTGEIFQSVAVPAGEHTLVFRFQPDHIGLAWVLFGLGVLGLVGATPAVSERIIRPR
jgi:hypothetical protein